MQQIAKAFAVAFGPNEDQWDPTSNLLPAEAKNMFDGLKDQHGGADKLMTTVKRFRIPANLRIVSLAIMSLPRGPTVEDDGEDEDEDDTSFDRFDLNYFKQNKTYTKLTRPDQALFDNLKEKYDGNMNKLLQKLKNMSVGEHTALSDELVDELQTIDANNSEGITDMYDRVNKVLVKDYSVDADVVKRKKLMERWGDFFRRHKGKHNIDKLKKHHEELKEEHERQMINQRGWKKVDFSISATQQPMTIVSLTLQTTQAATELLYSTTLTQSIINGKPMSLFMMGRSLSM